MSGLAQGLCSLFNGKVTRQWASPSETFVSHRPDCSWPMTCPDSEARYQSKTPKISENPRKDPSADWSWVTLSTRQRIKIHPISNLFGLNRLYTLAESLFHREPPLF